MTECWILGVELFGNATRSGWWTPSKAKYVQETDSEQVPWGKGEKHSDKESETVPETIRLQAVGAHLMCDGVPFA